MLAQERHKMIMELLKKDGTVRTSELVEVMAVSSETVRKDLDCLEQSGMLERVHGGAVPVSQKLVAEPVETYVSLEARNAQRMEEKSAIVSLAAGLVKEKQVVALDYGSTSLLMAKELAARFRSLTVITNSIQNALALVNCPDFTVILVGGILNKEELSLGNDFSTMLDRLHIERRAPLRGTDGPGIQRGQGTESDAAAGQPDGGAGGFRQIRKGQPGEDLRPPGGERHSHRQRPGSRHGGGSAGHGSGADGGSGTEDVGRALEKGGTVQKNRGSRAAGKLVYTHIKDLNSYK